jgi:hypothetical protein
MKPIPQAILSAAWEVVQANCKCSVDTPNPPSRKSREFDHMDCYSMKAFEVLSHLLLFGKTRSSLFVFIFNVRNTLTYVRSDEASTTANPWADFEQCQRLHNMTQAHKRLCKWVVRRLCAELLRNVTRRHFALAWSSRACPIPASRGTS